MENEEHKSNVSVAEIDPETDQKLKGDAIGDTMYSQSGILKTLLALSDMKWSEQLEDDLCFLWDSTTDKEVCDFLYNHKFPALVRSTIEEYHDNARFVEIMVGTLANILLNFGKDKQVNKEDILPIVDILNKTADPLILVEVVRVMTALSYFRLMDLDVYYTDQIDHQLKFILQNSNNVNLLEWTMDFFSKVGCRLNKKYLTGDFIQNVVTAYKTIMEDVTCIESEQGKSAVSNFVQIITTCCGCIKNREEKRQEFLPGITNFLKEATEIFKYYADLEDELFLDLSNAFHVSGTGFIVVEMNIPYSKELFLDSCRLYQEFGGGTYEVEEFSKMIAYFIYKGDFEEIKQDLVSAQNGKRRNPIPGLTLFYDQTEEEESFCDFPFKEKLGKLLRECKEAGSN